MAQRRRRSRDTRTAQPAQRRARDTDGILPVLAKAVREIESRLGRGQVERTKFQVVALLVREERAHVKADQDLTEARRGEQLKRLDGGTYAQTLASGTPSYGMQGSSISAGAVEMSNTDIAEEFSKMIVTQQAYSANTRVITTAQQMLEEVINVIR